MVVYCFECWTENQYHESNCRNCGARLFSISEESFVDKLISALHHPEPTTPLRAAFILGQRQEKQAVKPLLELAKTCTDPYILSAVVNALGQIGDTSAIETLEQLLATSFLNVRLEIIQALRSIGGHRSREILQQCQTSNNEKIRVKAHLALLQIP
ncbi:MAG: HEAT repeat domain-containing protein [bacterium]|nr:HEAT repeat domain-containing protein [bacterium]